MIEKRFFLLNLLKTHFSFTFAISEDSKRALFVQNNPPKTEKIDVFNILVDMGYTLKKSYAGDIWFCCYKSKQK